MDVAGSGQSRYAEPDIQYSNVTKDLKLLIGDF